MISLNEPAKWILYNTIYSMIKLYKRTALPKHFNVIELKNVLIGV